MSALIHVAEKAPFMVMNPADPTVLTGLIPGVRPVRLWGHELWAVPHTLDAVKVLRNLGAPAPSPILHRYGWPGRYTPFHAQRETAAFLTLHRRAYVLNDMGTGKTIAALWAFDYLRSIGQAHRLLIFSPLSTLDAVWGSEILLNFPHLRYAVLHADRAKRLKLLAADYDVYIINHDGVKIIAPELKNRPDIDVVLVDELSAFRSAGTERFKAMSKVTAPLERIVWGMGATPAPNEPPDAWAQVRLVTPGEVTPYFKRFKEQTMRQVTAFRWEPKPDAMDTVYRVMRPAIRFTRAQCMDLPPTLYQYRRVELTTEQQNAYEQMKSKLKIEHAGGTARAVNAADQAMKLVQIACGAVRNSETGEPILLANTARVAVVKEVIEQAQGKVIVYVPFIAALESLRDELAKHWPTALVYGETPREERTDIFHRFQHGSEQDLRVLVANPRVMSHGLTLTAADTVIWFAPTTSHETFDQACHRIIRAGQRRTTLVLMLEGTPAERKLYKVLRERADLQNALLQLAEGDDSEGGA